MLIYSLKYTEGVEFELRGGRSTGSERLDEKTRKYARQEKSYDVSQQQPVYAGMLWSIVEHETQRFDNRCSSDSSSAWTIASIVRPSIFRFADRIKRANYHE